MLWEHATAALDRLRSEYELIILEGAGSPAELNLKRGDIVNMAIAKYAQSPVLLAGNIDLGGIFAQLLGTLDLFEPDERALVKGLIINKFRGDPTLFYDGAEILEQRGNVPVLGVVTYLHNHGMPEEDAVAIESPMSQSKGNALDIAIIRLPRISNFDDFDPLANEPNISIRYISTVEDFGTPNAVILPGTKSTMADLLWMREQGLDTAIIDAEKRGASIVGICGGYQMLGSTIIDLNRVESDVTTTEGLGLIDSKTVFMQEKSTRRTKAKIKSSVSWLGKLDGQTITGYEIHMGQTTPHSSQKYPRWLHTESRRDGTIRSDGRVWGCYLHGIFENANFRRAWLYTLGWGTPTDAPQQTFLQRVDHLADHVEDALDMQRLDQIIGL
jgi:adenosylcobyric acid synthase